MAGRQHKATASARRDRSFDPFDLVDTNRHRIARRKGFHERFVEQIVDMRCPAPRRIADPADSRLSNHDQPLI